MSQAPALCPIHRGYHTINSVWWSLRLFVVHWHMHKRWFLDNKLSSNRHIYNTHNRSIGHRGRKKDNSHHMHNTISYIIIVLHATHKHYWQHHPKIGWSAAHNQSVSLIHSQISAHTRFSHWLFLAQCTPKINRKTWADERLCICLSHI